MIITKKPWGIEKLLYKKRKVRFKLLHIAANEILSLQFHREKKEFLVCATGQAYINHLTDEDVFFNTGDCLYIGPKQLHRIYAIKDCVFAELSVGDDSDIVRIEDKYGRC